jgi:hypothetical protein
VLGEVGVGSIIWPAASSLRYLLLCLLLCCLLLRCLLLRCLLLCCLLLRCLLLCFLVPRCLAVPCSLLLGWLLPPWLEEGRWPPGRIGGPFEGR